MTRIEANPTAWRNGSVERSQVSVIAFLIKSLASTGRADLDLRMNKFRRAGTMDVKMRAVGFAPQIRVTRVPTAIQACTAREPGF